MERLTRKTGCYLDVDGIRYVQAPSHPDYFEILNKLGEYEDAEEQGLLLRLPCKLGGKLYDITEFFNIEGYQEIYEMDARKIEISRDKEGLIYTIDGADYREKDFGKVLFKTEAEAEKAIREMGE